MNASKKHLSGTALAWLGCVLAVGGCAGQADPPASADAGQAPAATPAASAAPAVAATPATSDAPARPAAARATPDATATPAAARATPGAMLSGDNVHEYIDAVRKDLSSGKVHMITDVMQLNASEAATFWPIYEDYESELFALGDERLEGIKAFVQAQKAGAMDDKTAADLTDRYFKYEEERLALVKQYRDTISKELSPVRGAQFTQIEHRFSTAIDLILASELPLVRQEPARADAGSP